MILEVPFALSGQQVDFQFVCERQIHTLHKRGISTKQREEISFKRVFFGILFIVSNGTVSLSIEIYPPVDFYEISDSEHLVLLFYTYV